MKKQGNLLNGEIRYYILLFPSFLLSCRSLTPMGSVLKQSHSWHDCSPFHPLTFCPLTLSNTTHTFYILYHSPILIAFKYFLLKPICCFLTLNPLKVFVYSRINRLTSGSPSITDTVPDFRASLDDPDIPSIEHFLFGVVLYLSGNQTDENTYSCDIVGTFSQSPWRKLKETNDSFLVTEVKVRFRWKHYVN